MITYEQIIRASQSGPTPYEWEPGGCLKMVNHYHPFSIKPVEFRTIHDFIAANGLRRGFEIGTGLGISALAASLAMRATRGRMVTLDSFIEERHNHYLAYTQLTDVYNESADAYRGLAYLRSVLGLENVLIPCIGRSPESVASTIRAHYGDEKLDYVMIDAEHTDSGLVRDLGAVQPFLAERHAVFLHDTHCFDPALVAGAYWFPECRLPHGWNLAVIDNVSTQPRTQSAAIQNQVAAA